MAKIKCFKILFTTLLLTLHSPAYPATYYVTSYVDDATMSGTLRNALLQTQPGDSVVFSSLLAQPITIGSGDMETALPMLQGVTINGPGNTISGNNLYPIFFAYSGTNNINDLNLTNGFSLGGDGGIGTGGDAIGGGGGYYGSDGGFGFTSGGGGGGVNNCVGGNGGGLSYSGSGGGGNGGAVGFAGNGGCSFGGAIFLANGAQLNITDGTFLNNALGPGGTGTIDGTIAGSDLYLMENTTATFTTTTAQTIYGTIAGSGSLVKSGPSTLTLSGYNSYSGTTTLTAGTLQAGSADAFPSPSAFIITDTGGAHLI